MAVSTATQEEVTKRNGAMAPYLLSKTKAELCDNAVEKEILLIPVNTVKDIAESPQLRAREYWQEVAHPELEDTIVYTGWPVKWTELPSYRPRYRAPLIGEHNRDIYEGELGLTREQMVLLKTRGVI